MTAGPDVAVVFGTRPEMIKLAPLIAALGRRALTVHTGQHFDASMSATFLEQLHIGEPDMHLSVGGLTRGAQIGNATVAIEALLLEHRPSCLVVQGDTNSGVAGALAANAAEVKVVHLEAGLRSFDRAMPEEHNRVVIDALSDLCLAPHESNAELLRREGVADDRIRVSGSTLSEALHGVMPDGGERAALLERYGLGANSYVVATIHRAENADNEANLRAILGELASLPMPVLLPLHPRTKARVQSFGLEGLITQLRVTEPLSYREFIGLAAECALIVSDSGGVQEEATIVKRPVVIVRNSTERPELLGTFAHLVPVGPAIGDTARALLADVAATHASLSKLPYPYGADVAARCVAYIDELLHT
jgi:UDP-N-acetylglucosamine 2-epimerase (non-hydrolysing)